MTGRTAHIIPTDGGWAVMKGGVSSSNGSRTKAEGVYTTQREAIAAGRQLASAASVWQVVLHGRDGSFRIVERHGLPKVQHGPDRSTLGRETIKKAISAVIRERLLVE